jgi:hypothetical protein
LASPRTASTSMPSRPWRARLLNSWVARMSFHLVQMSAAALAQI